MIKAHIFGASNGYVSCDFEYPQFSQDRLQQTMSQKSVMEEVLEVSLQGGNILGAARWGQHDGGY